MIMFNENSMLQNKTHLSPVIIYYLRQILRQNLDRLKFVVATGAALKADPLSDLNAVIDSLYLDPEEVVSTYQKLEKLVEYHQKLATQGFRYRQALTEVEQQIFWLLGFRIRQEVAQGKILIVDDVPQNIKLLSVTLSNHGYEIESAMNGAQAITLVQKDPPDLILLDIMMPGMDGYETCERLKADEKTRHIPVLFVSAIDDVKNKVRGFEVGAVDYIAKPFRVEEVLARVEHQLKISSLQKRLADQNERLQQEKRNHLILSESLREEKERVKRLLGGIFPSTLAEKLNPQGTLIPDWDAPGILPGSRGDVTLLWVNFAGIHQLTQELSPSEFLSNLDRMIKSLDRLCEEKGLEPFHVDNKHYQVICGLFNPDPHHAQKIVSLALKIEEKWQDEKGMGGITPGICIHTGRVTGGVLTGRKIHYHIWGEPLEIMEKMGEQEGEGKILVTETTLKLLHEHYQWEKFGMIPTEGQALKTYWLKGFSD